MWAILSINDDKTRSAVRLDIVGKFLKFPIFQYLPQILSDYKHKVVAYSRK